MSSSFCGLDISKWLTEAAMQHLHGQSIALGDQTRIIHSAAGFQVMMSFAAVCGDPHHQLAAEELRLIQIRRKHPPEQQRQSIIVHHAGRGELIGLLERQHSLQCPFVEGGAIIFRCEISPCNQCILDELNSRAFITQLDEAYTVFLIALAGDLSHCAGAA